MIKLSTSEIHDFLKMSQLYENMIDQDTSTIPIDKKYYVKSLEINSMNDLIKMLEMCRYWMVDELPHQLFKYILTLSDPVKIYNDYFNDSKKENEQPQIIDLNKHFQDYLPKNDIFILAKYKGGDKYKLKTIDIVKTCSLNLLKYLYENKEEFNVKFPHTVCNYAAENPDVRIIKYLHKKEFNLNSTRYASSVFGDELYNICTVAIKGGLDVLKYVHKNSGQHNKYVIITAASHGKLDCLKYCIKHNFNRSNLNCRHAVKHFECFKYIYDNRKKLGIAHGPLTYEWAACEKCYDVLNYLYEKEAATNTLLWNYTAFDGAISADDFEMVKWLHEKGCKCLCRTCAFACGHGKLDCLKYFVENGCELKLECGTLCIYRGNLDCLKYCLEYFKQNNIAIEGICDTSIYDEDNYDMTVFDEDREDDMEKITECLKYIKDNGYEFTYKDIKGPLNRYNTYELVKYMYQNSDQKKFTGSQRGEISRSIGEYIRECHSNYSVNDLLNFVTSV